jgi:hypothetical protein
VKKGKTIKIIISIIIVLAVFFGGVFIRIYLESIHSQQKHKRWEQEREAERIKILDERYAKYKVVSQIIQEYDKEIKNITKNLTTETIQKQNPERVFAEKYAENITGSTMYLFVQVLNVKQVNNHREIFVHQSPIVLDTRLYDSIEFYFYDDEYIIDDVNKLDKLDIKIKVNDFSIDMDNKLNIYCSIIDLEYNYRDRDMQYNYPYDQRL